MSRFTPLDRRNDVNFTVKLAPSQIKFLSSLRPALGASSEQSVLREIIDQFERWFYLPVYQREALQNELAAGKTNIFEYIQELLARHFEELSDSTTKGTDDSTRKIPTKVEEHQPFAVRMPVVLLSYADELKPQLRAISTADVVREIVSQVENWFELSRYQAERLQQDMQSRRLNVIEYLREILARRYEALREKKSPPTKVKSR